MVDKNELIEELLQKYRPVIGRDYWRYRNHVYRVFTNCRILDKQKANEEKYAIAAVFHDIGIWTHHTIDYLLPSIGRAQAYLVHSGKQHLETEIVQMIMWHHKISTYKGGNRNVVETFRRADWIDVSLGLITFGIDKKRLWHIRQTFPNVGFHYMLVKKILKNILIHPAHPLPMFKS